MSESNDIVPQESASLATRAPTAPSYLQVQDDKSIAELQQYIRPPRVKVVQSLTDEDLRRTFGVGSVVLLPQGLCIMEMPRDSKGNPLEAEASPIIFTPLFFFAEFCVWNPLELKGAVSAIRERTFDPNTAIARTARDFGRRTQPYPEDPQYEIQYVEHMNFVCAIQGVEDACILSFARAEFTAGQKFASQTKMRAQVGCPLYGGVYAANIGHRKNNKGDWYGLDISNPPEGIGPYALEETFHRYKAMYTEYSEQHANACIRVDYADEATTTVEAVDSSEAAASM